MADTPRDYATNITNFADNSAGAITAQNVRDLVASCRHIIDGAARRPTVANAADDEFDGSSLGASWSSWNAGSNMTVAVANSRASIVLAPAETANAVRGILRAAPVAQAWRYETRGFRFFQYGANGRFGLVARVGGGTAPNVANVTTDKLQYFAIDANTTSHILYALYYSNATTFVTSDLGGTGSGDLVGVELALDYDGSTNLRFELSPDGGANWWRLGVVATATHLGAAPDSIGLACDGMGVQQGLGGCLLSVDAFRRTI